MFYFKNNSVNWLYVFVLYTVIVITQCAPLPTDNDAKILNYEFTNNGKGNYNYRFQTSNGIIREETGILIDEGLSTEHIFVFGSYTYDSPEGKLVTVNYTADEKGFITVTSPPKEIYSSPVSPAVLATLLG